MIHVFPIISKGYGFSPQSAEERPISSMQAVPGHDCRWAAMQDFAKQARNHCAATTITNLTQIVLQRLPLRATGMRNIDERFNRIHTFVPNGPIFNLEKYANRYFEKEGLPLHCTTIRRNHRTEEERERLLEAIRHEIYAGRPCALLVSSAMFGWHWVLCLGTVQYKNGPSCLLIEDNWHHEGLQLYVPDKGSTLQRVVIFHGMPKA